MPPLMPGMPPPGMGGGPPGGGMPGLPGQPPPPTGAPGPGQGMPIPGLDQMGQMGLTAIDRLMHREPNGQTSMMQVKEALKLSGQLIAAVLPLIQQWDPKLSKDLHVIGRQIADAQINLTKDNEPGPPPEALMAGIPGMPGASPLGSPPGTAGGVGGY